LIVLGLTGSIGMGKSAAAAMLRRLGVPVFDADLTVHRLLASSGAAVPAVSAAFPGVETEAGGIDRVLLGQRVFTDPGALRRLEEILHPMVAAEEKRFLARSRAQRVPLVVLDIPLLFETGAERRCDYVLVVSAPALVQRQRVMRRPGMTEIRLDAIRRKQMPDHQKRLHADFVVQTGAHRGVTLRRLKSIVRLLHKRGRR
jgi:dephospho-CoA kinase